MVVIRKNHGRYKMWKWQHWTKPNSIPKINLDLTLILNLTHILTLLLLDVFFASYALLFSHFYGSAFITDSVETPYCPHRPPGWKILWYFRFIYRAFAHTLLKLYEIYYQIIVCVCALHIRWSSLLLSFTMHCCRKVQSDRSCPILRKCWGQKSDKPAKHIDWK